MDYRFLGKVNSSAELKALSENNIPEFCREIRHELVARVTENGGHLASNLGVVELTLALHRVFDFPDDKLIFDVGHQSYVHKLITGRFKDFDTLRKPGGISGFEKRGESEYDFFGTGHAGTSLSAALAFAEAEKLRGGKRYAIAVVGDGSYTNGMIHEALNNCSSNLRLIIVLNENEMSISHNTGGFARYITKVRTSKKYYGFKGGVRNFTEKIPFVGRKLVLFISKKKRALKNKVYSSNIYEDMGIYYIGPCDGNDFIVTERLLRRAKSLEKCCILHIHTVKGKGYEPAETNPTKYHGLPAIEDTGCEKGESFSSHFGKVICEKAKSDKTICAITAAMADGTGLDDFAEEYPERFFDVGIAEEHGATFAAGLSASGMKPVYAVYSTFFQRAFDSLVHDIALQGLPVITCLDRAGLAFNDGPTHHGLFDVSLIMTVPGTVLYAPLDFVGFDKAFEKALSETRPTFIRYKSGTETILNGFHERFDFIRTNFTGKKKKLIITYGRIAREAVTALNNIGDGYNDTGIVVLEKLKGDPLLTRKILSMIEVGTGKIIFLEEGIRIGGAGQVITDSLRDNGINECFGKKITLLAIDSFGQSEKDKSLFETCHISHGDVERLLKDDKTVY